jgi:hypothetical protein
VDDRDRLAFYPFVVVRIACRVCSRNGAYRLARLSATPRTGHAQEAQKGPPSWCPDKTLRHSHDNSPRSSSLSSTPIRLCI